MRVSPKLVRVSFGILFVIAAVVTALPAAASPPEGSSPPGARIRSPLSVLEGFLEAGTPPSPPVTGGTDKEDLWLALGRRGIPAEAILASIPDPSDSEMSERCERLLEAIGRSLETDGFELDRGHLPWKDKGLGATAGNEEAREGSKVSEAEDAGARATADGEVGALLFRSLGWPTTLRLVLLVPESPATGLWPGSFGRALDTLLEVERKALPLPRSRRPVNPTLRLLGPYFSPSAHSMRAQLDAWLAPRAEVVDVQIVSGTAGGVDAAALPSRTDLGGKARLSFSSTTLQDELVLSVFLEEFLRVRYGKGHLALLYESAGRGATLASRAAGGWNVSVVPLPPRLADLRRAYGSDGREDSGRSDSKSPKPRGVEGEASGSKASAGVVAGSLDSRSSGGLLLDSILTSIAWRDIRYVGLIASDARDVTFLAQRIRDICPDTVLFTLGADVRYSNPRERALRGLLVVSTYPPLAYLEPLDGGSSASGPNGIRSLTFPDTFSAGVFNAARALFGRKDLIAYDGGGPWYRPAIWVSAPGNRGLRVLSKIDSGRWDAVVRTTSVAPHRWYRLPNDARLAVFLFITTVVFLLGSLGLVVGRLKDPPGIGVKAIDDLLRATWRRARVVRPCPADAENVNRERRRILVLFVGVSALGYGVLAWTLGSLRWSFSPITIRTIGVIVMVATLGVLLFITAHLARSQKRPLSILAAAAVALAIACLPIYLPHVLEDADTTLLRARRWGAIGEPASPLLAIVSVLAIVQLYFLAVLRRLRLLGERLLPAPGNRREGEGELEPFVDALSREVYSPRTGDLERIILTAIFALVAWQLRRNFIPSVDGRALSLIFLTFYGCAALLVVQGLLRFLHLWHLLSGLLRRLALHPLCEVSRRMPPALTRTVWKLYDLPPSFMTLTVALQYLDAMKTQGAPIPEAPLAEAHKALREALEADAPESTKDVVDLRAAARAKIRVAASGIEEAVQEAWRTGGSRTIGQGTAACSTLDLWKKAADLTLLPRAEEELMAVRAIAVIHHVFSHLRVWLTFAVSGLLLLLFAGATYGLEPRHFLQVIGWLVVIAFVVLTLKAFTDMDRDVVLSNMSKTVPGRVTWSWEFLSRLFVYGAIPILSLVLAQFPRIGEMLFAWGTPIARILP